MSYTIKKKLANKSNYGGKRSTSDIKWIVIHYTGNDGDSDENNGIYFANNIVKASAHYFVDGDSVTQSVPDNYIAYSVGGSRYSNYKQTGGAKHYGQATNSNTLNIELCDPDKNGVIKLTNKTEENAIKFIQEKMKQYNIDINHVIRHFDVTGKQCPGYFCYSSNNDKAWEEFKKKLTNTNKEDSKETQKTESATKPSSTVKYYKKFSNKSLVDGLKSIGVDSSFANRKKIAASNNITNYKGSSEQNQKLLALAAKGKLVKN